MTLDLNKIYNGDCLEIMDKLILNGVKTKFTFTSPPYNRERNDKYNNADDTNPDYYIFLCGVIDRCLEISDYLFLNVQHNYYNKQDIFKLIGKYCNNIIDIVIWEKSNPMTSANLCLTNSYEYIIIISKIETKIKTNGTYIKNHITTNVYSKNPYSHIHRAVMNPDIPQWFIQNFTNEDDTILDCFMGVGTTAVACINTGRNFIGIEKDKEYFNIAQKRVKEAQGQRRLF